MTRTPQQSAQMLADLVLDALRRGKLGDSVLLRNDEVDTLISLCREVKGSLIPTTGPVSIQATQ